jgi:CarboxypepD_reg-like domain
MKHTLLFFAILFHCAFADGQFYLKGIIIDVESNRPVPYVSIGVIGKATGTVANVNGEFELILDDKINDNDTIRFSSIGYESSDYSMAGLKTKQANAPVTITLKKTVNELKPVAVNSKHAKVKILGYDTNSKLFGLGFGSGAIGSEGGVLIPIKHPNTNIENFSFFIIQNPFDNLTFRLNIYEMNNGTPGKNILNENVLVEIENKKAGKIIIDLSKYYIEVSADILVTLEWLEASPKTNANLDVGAALFGSTYIRQASQSVWIKKKAGIGFSVKANY